MKMVIEELVKMGLLLVTFSVHRDCTTMMRLLETIGMQEVNSDYAVMLSLDECTQLTHMATHKVSEEGRSLLSSEILRYNVL